MHLLTHMKDSYNSDIISNIDTNWSIFNRLEDNAEFLLQLQTLIVLE